MFYMDDISNRTSRRGDGRGQSLSRTVTNHDEYVFFRFANYSLVFLHEPCLSFCLSASALYLSLFCEPLPPVHVVGAASSYL